MLEDAYGKAKHDRQLCDKLQQKLMRRRDGRTRRRLGAVSRRNWEAERDVCEQEGAGGRRNGGTLTERREN